jgi:hypothetical protein
MKKLLLLTTLLFMMSCKKEDIKIDLKCFIGSSTIFVTNTSPNNGGNYYYGSMKVINDCSGNDTIINCYTNQNYLIWYNSINNLDGGKTNLGKSW